LVVVWLRALRWRVRMILWRWREKQIPRLARFLRQGKQGGMILVLRRTGRWETRSEKGTGLKTRRYNCDRRGGGGACR
jgi:hypothetical protein